MASDRDETAPAATRVRFGVFEFDLRSLELERSGHAVPLRPQPARLLALLVREAGNLVDRDTIRREVWGDDVIVEFDQGVHSCIRQIRSALGDDAQRPRFVETVPKRGYRFLADVHTTSSAAPTSTTPPAVASPPSSPSPPETPRRPWSILFVGVLVVLMIGVVWTQQRNRNQADSAHNLTRLRLAVLPFENLSDDESKEYFADGLTEELIAHLTRIRPEQLAIIARTSVMGYKGSGRPIRDIGVELSADYILEGSVRHAEGRVRVTTQLIASRSQETLWSETFDKDLGHIFALQGVVASQVAEALAQQILVPQAATRQGSFTASSQAYDLYLRGRHQWNRFDEEGMQRAEDLLRQAVQHDPEFALAWAALADVYNLIPFYTDMSIDQAYAEAKRCARRALEIDPQVAAAHNSLGFTLFYYDREWDAADAAFRRAIELEPGNAMAHHWYTGVLSAMGRHDEAIHHNRLAVELDPLSLTVRSDLACYYMFARRYEEAVAEARRGLEQEPYHGWSRYILIVSLLKLERYEEARHEIRERLVRNGDPTDAIDALTDMPAQEAIQRFHNQGIDVRIGKGWSMNDGPYGFAIEHAFVGRTEPALDALELALETRDSWIVFAAVDPRLDGLRHEPRFQNIVRQLGLESAMAGAPSTDL